MEITIATLIYKSPAYLDFVMESLLEHRTQNHKIKYLIVCNDATEEVKESALDWSYYLGGQCRTVIHDNPNPTSYWIQRVYSAWSRCVTECETEAVAFVNSDMRFTDGWLDNLAKHDLNKFVPTSRLVESARMPSLPGLISKNFGQTIKDFKLQELAFQNYAKEISEDKTTLKIGAYMPSLIKTDWLRQINGWHPNAWNQYGHEIPGDRITFAILEQRFGIQNIMCHDSIVYHLQRGESAESGDL